MNSNNKRRVVITGLGTVNPTGSTVKESWAAVKAGRCAVGPITAFDTADFKVKLPRSRTLTRTPAWTAAKPARWPASPSLP